MTPYEIIKNLVPRKLLDHLRKQKRMHIYRHRVSLSSDQYATELEKSFTQRTGEALDLDNPVTFNQKVQWLKLYDSTPLKGRLADKYLVREFIADTIGEQYLVPLLGAWSSADEIPFEELPERFALKASHGSSWNIIVTDKSSIDEKAIRETVDEWLEIDYSFWSTFELHYQFCEPRVIAEQYLEGFATGDLIDYKFHMFNAGEPIILVCRDRAGEGHPKKAYYDGGWNKIDLLEKGSESFDVPKPQNLERMLEYSERLAEGFALVRVDWYEVNGRLFFGEMTFTPANGMKEFVPSEWNNEFGKRIDLTVLPAWQAMHEPDSSGEVTG